jgi:hypothetical protein
MGLYFDIALFILALVIAIRMIMAKDWKKSWTWALITLYWIVNAVSKIVSAVASL